MSAEVFVIAPVNGAILDPSNTTVIVDVVDALTAPGHAIYVTINGVTAFFRVTTKKTITYVMPGLTASVTAPAPNTTRITLTRKSLWSDPYEVIVTASYDPDGSGTYVSKTAYALAGTGTLQPASPSASQPDADPGTNVSLTFGSPAGGLVVLNGAITINGAPAVTFDPTSWVSPTFTGQLTHLPTFLYATIAPRRRFLADASVDVGVTLTLSAGGELTLEKSYTYRFYTRPNTPNTFNTSLRRTYVDAPFLGAPATETLRHVLQGALQARPLTAPFMVLLYNRVQRCSLRAVAAQLNLGELDAEVERLLPEDMASVMDVDAALAPYAILWDAALQEATAPADFLALLAKVYQAPYPQERVGALCALILSFTP